MIREFDPTEVDVHPKHLEMMDKVAKVMDGYAHEFGYRPDFERNAKNLDLVSFVPLGEPEYGATVEAYTKQFYRSSKYTGSTRELENATDRIRYATDKPGEMVKFLSEFEFVAQGTPDLTDILHKSGSRRGDRNHLKRKTT